MSKRSNKKNYATGKDIRGKHGTLTPASSKVVNAIRKECCGVEFVIGAIKQSSSNGETRVKHRRIKAGLEVKVAGNNAVQILYFYMKPHLRSRVVRVLNAFG